MIAGAIGIPIPAAITTAEVIGTANGDLDYLGSGSAWPTALF